MQIQNSVAFVTGANRGFGLALTRELVARGAARVYAGMRVPVAIDLPRVVPVGLDVTDPAQVEAAVAACGDVSLLVNNAGIARFGSYAEPAGVAAAREMLETNYFGMIRVTEAFLPRLLHNGGAVLNVLSVASWVSSGPLAPYAATKSAAWSYTNALRNRLREHGLQVLGLHVGFMETDLAAGIDAPKADPREVAAITLDALEHGKEEVMGDEITRQVKQGLSAEAAAYLRPIRP